MFITEEIIVKRATRIMNRDACVVGMPKPVGCAPGNRSANHNGITWFPEVMIARLNDGTILSACVGQIVMKCKEQGREQMGDWWWVFGITVDGKLELWAT